MTESVLYPVTFNSGKQMRSAPSFLAFLIQGAILSRLCRTWLTAELKMTAAMRVSFMRGSWLIEFIGLIGFIELIGLIEFIEFIELVELVGLIEFIELIELVELVGLIG